MLSFGPHVGNVISMVAAFPRLRWTTRSFQPRRWNGRENVGASFPSQAPCARERWRLSKECHKSFHCTPCHDAARSWSLFIAETASSEGTHHSIVLLARARRCCERPWHRENPIHRPAGRGSRAEWECLGCATIGIAFAARGTRLVTGRPLSCRGAWWNLALPLHPRRGLTFDALRPLRTALLLHPFPSARCMGPPLDLYDSDLSPCCAGRRRVSAVRTGGALL